MHSFKVPVADPMSEEALRSKGEKVDFRVSTWLLGCEM